MHMLSKANKEILANEDFRKLVSVRRRVSWSFLLVLLGLYLVFGLLSVYAPDVLAQPVFTGGVVPFGVLMGYGILGLTFTITLIYVWIANSYFTPLEKRIINSMVAGEKR